MWKLIATYAPILGATLIAGALTIDEYHNWYDCLAGAIIGTVMAFSSYWMVYASIWDWRVNRISLNRSVPFTGPNAELRNAVFTRQFGWGIRGGDGFGDDKNIISHGNGGAVPSIEITSNTWGTQHGISPVTETRRGRNSYGTWVRQYCLNQILDDGVKLFFSL
jgi:hypothetical protein